MSDHEFDSSAVESDFDFSDDTLLDHAENHKTIGNTLLKQGDLDEAKKAYNEGISNLDKMVSKTSERYTQCYTALHLNLSLVYIKKEEWFEGSQAATKALEKTPDNEKARLRRGVCHSRLGNWELAKTDLTTYLKHDPKSVEARRELQSVQQRAKESAQKQKAAFSGMFAKAGAGLYSDREEELKRLREEAAAREAALREKYELEMKDRIEETPQPSFEEWKKKREEEEQKASKPKDTPKENSAKENKPVVKSTQSVEDLDLDEEDLKVLEETKKKGYCYFRRELTEEEKRIRAEQHIPKKLDDATSPTTISESPNGKQRGVSEWNATGITFEEKDTTKWCSDQLSQILSAAEWQSEGSSVSMVEQLKDPEQFKELLMTIQATTSGQKMPPEAIEKALSKGHAVKIRITKAPEVKGEAQIMVVRGQKRWYYEFTTQLAWEITIGPPPDDAELTSELASLLGPTVPLQGTLNIDDLSSTSTDRGFDLAKINYTTPFEQTHRPLVDMAIRGLKQDLARRVVMFEQAYQKSQ